MAIIWKCSFSPYLSTTSLWSKRCQIAPEFGPRLAFNKVTCDGLTEQALPRFPKEHDNEDQCKAGNQDRCSNRSDGRRLHGRGCSAGSLRRRRTPHPVPPQTSELLDHLADFAQLRKRRAIAINF